MPTRDSFFFLHDFDIRVMVDSVLRLIDTEGNFVAGTGFALYEIVDRCFTAIASRYNTIPGRILEHQ